MKQVIVGVVVLAGLAGATAASAQESGRTETKMVVTVIPGGATFFKETKDGTGPSFGSYDLGGSAAVNFNRHIGIEGEFSGKLGVTQTLDGFANPTKTPNMFISPRVKPVSAANRPANESGRTSASRASVGRIA